MADRDALIDDIVAGDAYDLTRTITGVPNGQVLETGYLTVKRSEHDTDAQALFQVSITSSSGANGQITDTGADGTGAATFAISGTNSAKLRPGYPYRFDVQFFTDADKPFTPLAGTIRVKPGITRATS